MFPFDQAALPQIKPRRALIAIDFQNEFTSPDGVLAVSEPRGYLDKTIQLASAFRETGGDVIWVKSKFDGSRAVTEEKIIIADGASDQERASPPPAPARVPSGKAVPAALRAITSARRSNRPSTSVSSSVDSPVEVAGDPDSEAFLSKDEPACLKDSSSHFSDWSTDIKSAMAGTKDASLTKSHYSAFKGTRLLHVLRASMVMDIFICGSLANVGVYATAMDAAGHGLNITIVEDCCGYRREERQRQAIESLTDYTGCEIASMKEVFEMIGLVEGDGRKKEDGDVDGNEGEIEVRSGVDESGRASDSPDLVDHLTGLRLKSKSLSPQGVLASTTNTEGSTGAPLDGEAENKVDSQSESKLREASHIADIPDKTTSSEPGAANPSSSTAGEPKSVEMARHKQPSPDSEGDAIPPQKGLCEGDTDVITDLLPPDLESGIFDKLKDEITWQRMSHQGGEVPRLVAVQGTVSQDGSVPIYRHPSDESPPLLPFSPTVLAIKAATEKHLGHELNHALIQYYRDGRDYISEHSDKTLDIVRGSYIANVSLGAQRTMVLRTKRLDKDPSLPAPSSPDAKPSETTQGPGRKTQRAYLPHNSLCRMGLRTNEKWLHAIRRDNRADHDKAPSELAFSGGRISLTFRQIGTFLSGDEKRIWGQGARAKTREEAGPVVNGTGSEAIAMLKAFGAENHSSEFDWEDRYGEGFDVLHMSSSPRFFASVDGVLNLRIAVMMAELGMEWAKGSMGPAGVEEDEQEAKVKFVDDNDHQNATLNGELAILLYLDATRGKSTEDGRRPPTSTAKLFTRLQEALTWIKTIDRLQRNSTDDSTIKLIRKSLGPWNIAAAETDEAEQGKGFLACSPYGLVDYIVWPTLHGLVVTYGEDIFQDVGSLKTYYETFGAREGVKKALSRMPLS